MSIMCQGRLSDESVALAHLINVRQYFVQELESLKELERDGLVTLHDDGLEVTPLGWYFVRSVAMVFDHHLRADRSRERLSRVIG
jgi:oxygen-independent coproporphyrinogen-3 oxidase